MTQQKLDEIWKKHESRPATGEASQADKEYAKEIRKLGGECIRARQLQGRTTLTDLLIDVLKENGVAVLHGPGMTKGSGDVLLVVFCQQDKLKGS